MKIAIKMYDYHARQIYLKQSSNFVVNHLRCSWSDFVQFEERQTSVNIFFMKYANTDLSQQTDTLQNDKYTHSIRCI